MKFTYENILDGLNNNLFTPLVTVKELADVINDRTPEDFGEVVMVSSPDYPETVYFMTDPVDDKTYFFWENTLDSYLKYDDLIQDVVIELLKGLINDKQKI
jgi:hypothetical protein